MDPENKAPETPPNPQPTGETPPVQVTGVEPPAPNAETPPAPASKDAPAWATSRIDELTGKWREEQRASQAKDAELAVLRAANEELLKKLNGGTAPAATTAGAPTTAAAPAAPTSAPSGERMVPESKVKQTAAEIAAAALAEQKFNEACNKVWEQGGTQFKDWEGTIQNFAKLGGLPPAFLTVALETGDAAPAILHKLGSDLDQAAKIFKLPPTKMAMELAKMATEVLKAPPVSSAPAPITPISTHSSVPASAELSDTDPIDVWMAKREKQLAARSAH